MNYYPVLVIELSEILQDFLLLIVLTVALHNTILNSIAKFVFIYDFFLQLLLLFESELATYNVTFLEGDLHARTKCSKFHYLTNH